jgi:hypothetical protein
MFPPPVHCDLRGLAATDAPVVNNLKSDDFALNRRCLLRNEQAP